MLEKEKSQAEPDPFFMSGTIIVMKLSLNLKVNTKYEKTNLM
jgi:hypothetical protein